ncbi:hypothetical protein LTR12_016195 [Friedmanniomyces endolithicus]|nr:hypothetical protein LTR74_016616 [Friedmanniomyces endolithicus]KAK1809456.1 hypothetical protein LTR12_016195 [Friedmanniomyces endolithicus]
MASPNSRVSNPPIRKTLTIIGPYIPSLKIVRPCDSSKPYISLVSPVPTTALPAHKRTILGGLDPNVWSRLESHSNPFLVDSEDDSVLRKTKKWVLPQGKIAEPVAKRRALKSTKRIPAKSIECTSEESCSEFEPESGLAVTDNEDLELEEEASAVHSKSELADDEESRDELEQGPKAVKAVKKAAKAAMDEESEYELGSGSEANEDEDEDGAFEQVTDFGSEAESREGADGEMEVDVEEDLEEIAIKEEFEESERFVGEESGALAQLGE